MDEDDDWGASAVRFPLNRAMKPFKPGPAEAGGVGMVLPCRFDSTRPVEYGPLAALSFSASYLTVWLAESGLLSGVITAGSPIGLPRMLPRSFLNREPIFDVPEVVVALIEGVLRGIASTLVEADTKVG